MDIAWHRDPFSLPALSDYDLMCRLKTGRLASLAAVLGVYSAWMALLAAGRKEVSLEALAGFFSGAAEQLGVAFQILDDVKNLDTGVPGKKRGDDIVEGKKSLPVLLYLHRYQEKRDFVARCFTAARSNGTHAPEVEELIGALESAGVLEEAREKGLSLINESRKVFSAPFANGFPLESGGRKLLAGFIDLLI
jgi:octaprenyl-diphosphate synthase